MRIPGGIGRIRGTTGLAGSDPVFLGSRSKASAWGQTVSPSASYLEKHPPLGFKERPRVPAPGLARLRRVPSLRRRSVGPRRTDIHVLTALSRHPCGSAHCASSAFGLHPSRDWRCLSLLRRKIKSRSEADQERIKGGLWAKDAGDLWERACSRRHWYIRRILGV
jgi:hypothetical protein